MSHEENKISDLIDGGLAHKQEIYDRLTALQDKATAASRACIRYMDKDNPQTKKYLESLREHTEATKEINRLKKIFNEAETTSQNNG